MITYALLGASFLWPWNALITATALANSKLANSPLNKLFSSSTMSLSSLANLLCNLYLAKNPRNYRARVVYGQVLISVSFLLLAAVSELISGAFWFIVVMLVVLASSAGCAMVQNGVLAITQHIPDPKYALSMLNGQAVAGVLPCMLPLLFSKSSSLLLALCTFLSVSILSCAGLYLFTRGENATFIEMAEHPEHHVEEGRDNEVIEEVSVELKDILILIKNPAISIMLGFVFSLCYPVFANSVESTYISTKLFAPITHLIWNSGDLLGRLLCSYVPSSRIKNGPFLVQYSLLRSLFVVALVFLAHFRSDFWYLLTMLLFGISSGHLISSSISYAPSLVLPEQQPAAGGALGFVISVGLLAGSLFSFLVVMLL